MREREGDARGRRGEPREAIVDCVVMCVCTYLISVVALLIGSLTSQSCRERETEATKMALRRERDDVRDNNQLMRAK